MENMSKAKRKAIRDIKALLKPLSKDEQLQLIRDIDFQLEIEAIAQRILQAIDTRVVPRKRK